MEDKGYRIYYWLVEDGDDYSNRQIFRYESFNLNLKRSIENLIYRIVKNSDRYDFIGIKSIEKWNSIKGDWVSL